MATWEAVANIDFVYSADPSNADLCYWLIPEAGLGDNDVLGYHEVPGFTEFTPLYGVFNPTNPVWTEENNLPGGYSYITLVHELGHGLGLAHPHDGGSADDANNFPGVTGPNSMGTGNFNQGIWTVMSYIDGWNQNHTNDLSYGWEATPMAFDIAAIQSIYGANYTYKTGDDTYVLPEDNISGTYWSCLWDAGGTDTISNAACLNLAPCYINLNDAPLTGDNAGGYVSYNQGITGGFTIANSAIIENATGGLGDDVITGNEAANTLDGLGGADTMTGGLGNDTYMVNHLLDSVIETSALSTEIDEVKSSLTWVLGSNLEKLTLTGSSAINGTGNTLNNTIIGNSGVNTLNGGAGADVLSGYAGNDTYVVDNNADTITEAANAGTDTVQSSVTWVLGSNLENLTLTGSSVINGTGNALNNIITGNSAANSLNGGSGADKFVFDITPASSNIDTIKDFLKGTDKIVLDDDTFTAFAGKTSIATSQFKVVNTTSALSGNAYLTYCTANDTLYYDSNGSGTGDVAFAKVELTGTASLTYTDFTIIA